MHIADLGDLWSTAWPWVMAVIAAASSLDAILPQPAPGSHWLPLRLLISFVAINVKNASNGPQQPAFTTWLVRIISPVLVQKGIIPVGERGPIVVDQSGTGTASISGGAVTNAALVIAFGLVVSACGATGTTGALQPGSAGQLAEQAAGVPQAVADTVIPAKTPQQRALRLYVNICIIADEGVGRALGDKTLAGSVYGGISVAVATLDAMRASLKTNAKPVLLNTMMYSAAVALVPPVKAIASADKTWLIGQIINPNVTDILSAVEGAASRGALAVNEVADAVAQMQEIQSRPNVEPTDDDFAPWSGRVHDALERLKSVAASPS